MPVLLICFILAQLSRFNISFAKVTFGKDIKLDDATFGAAASLFYVGYLAFQLPSGILLSRFGARALLCCIMVAWGAVGALQMFAHDAGDLYLLRFLLGAAQAGFFPGMIFFLSTWFPDRMRGRINSLFTTAIPLAGIAGGPLAAWIMAGLDGAQGLHGWQWLFLVEGLSAIVMGVAAYVLLTNGPRSAGWLEEAEKDIILADQQAQRTSRATIEADGIAAALREPKLLLLGAIYFGYFCALNAVALWGPSLLALAGARSIVSVGWISGLSALVATAGMLVIGRSSDRLQERHWHVGLCGLVAAGCFLLLPAVVTSVAATAGLLMLAATGLYAILGLFWTIPGEYLKAGMRARGFAVINMLGVCGGVVSPTLVGWLNLETGSLHVGLMIVAAILTISMIALLLLASAAARSMRH